MSWEGRFRIALPAGSQSAYESITPESSGKPNAGASYDFKVKEAEFNIQFVDRTDGAFAALRPSEIEEIYTQMADAMVRNAGGEKQSETKLQMGSTPGRTLKIKTAAGDQLTVLSYLAGNRLYMLVARVNPSVAGAEALMDKALASFKILTQTEIEAIVAKKVLASTPKALPQVPVVAKQQTDAQDENLKGRVKMVVEEDQDLSGTWQTAARRRSAEKHFNLSGNFLKEISYDPDGYPADVTVWGYLNRARVSNSNAVEGGSLLIVTMDEPPDTRGRDTRYQFKHVYKYLNSRLAELQLIHNNGQLWMKYVHKYSGNEMTELVYDKAGELNQKYAYTYDERGNMIDHLGFDTFSDPEKVESHYRYRYESFDSEGNWTQRRRFEIIKESGQETEKPSLIEYRTITYYPRTGLK